MASDSLDHIQPMPDTGAQLTLAVLRFVAGVPSEPEFRWHVWPGGSRVTDAGLEDALAAMKKPCAVMVHVEPGGLTALPLLEAGGPDEQARHRTELTNQQEYLREKLTRVGMRDDATPVLFQVEHGAIMVSAGELQAWASDYVLPSCGWTVQRSSDPRAAIRFVVRRPDGTWSTGFERHGCDHAT